MANWIPSKHCCCLFLSNTWLTSIFSGRTARCVGDSEDKRCGFSLTDRSFQIAMIGAMGTALSANCGWLTFPSAPSETCSDPYLESLLCQGREFAQNSIEMLPWATDWSPNKSSMFQENEKYTHAIYR